MSLSSSPSARTSRKKRIASPSQSPSSSSTKAKKRVVKWSDFHCDPIQDMVLVSKDEVYFRASSHALKRESTLFNGMLSSIPNQHQTVDDAIALDFSAAAIDMFLNAYSTPSPLSYGETHFALFHEYHKLLEYLDADRLYPHAHRTYKAMCTEKPVERLIVASFESDLPAARAALVQCRVGKQPLDATNYLGIVKRLHPSWHFRLLDQLLEPYSGRGTGEKDSLRVAWMSDRRIDILLGGLQDRIAEARLAGDASLI